ncbi:thioredoxin family protein [Butyricimonas paravirosa]
MKNIFIFCLLLLAPFICSAQMGVHFENLTLDEAFAKAQKENKLVFLDCYTSWCGPCKEMAEKEFTKKEAGEYFPPRFVCIKSDIERGVGKEIAKRYNITTVPTFLILYPNGEIIHTIVGSSPLLTFIDKIKTALKEETTLSVLDKEYVKGKMGKAQLLVYAEALAGAKRFDEAGKVCEKLLEKLSKKEKFSKEYWPLMSGQIISKGYKEHVTFVIQNQEKFNQSVGKEIVDAYLCAHYNGYLSVFLYGNPDKDHWEELDREMSELASLNFSGKDLIEKKVALAKARRVKDIDQVIALLEEMPEFFGEKELSMLMYTAEYIQDECTKEQLARIAAMEDKYVAAVEAPERVFYMRMRFTPYKRLASEGIYWEQDSSFESLLLKAKIEGKLIFMDCYTSWCGPCKQMESNVFPQKKVGDYFNRNFICVKWDMQKGEGVQLAQRFEINVFPTMLLISQEGDISYRVTGAMDAEHLIESFTAGLENVHSFEKLKTQYSEGDRSKDFLIKYSKALFTARSLDVQDVVAELVPLLSDEERTSKDFWYIYGTPLLTAPGSENEKYLIANRDRFRKNIGAVDVDIRLSFKYYMRFLQIMRNEDQGITPEEFNAIKDTLLSLDFVDRTVISYANIVEAGKFATVDQILTVCEKEFPLLLPERVPVDVFGNFIKDRMTPQQKVRWIKLGEKMINRFDDERMRKLMLENLRKEMAN